MHEAIMKDATPSCSGTENMYLNFAVDGEQYGVGIGNVIQITGMKHITPLPDMPDDMKGFIVLRGDIIPVVSMRSRFGKPEREYGERACIIVVQVGEKEIGFIVDAIHETVAIGPESISPRPDMGGGAGAAFIAGVARLAGGRMAILLHTRKLFAERGCT